MENGPQHEQKSERNWRASDAAKPLIKLAVAATDVGAKRQLAGNLTKTKTKTKTKTETKMKRDLLNARHARGSLI